MAIRWAREFFFGKPKSNTVPFDPDRKRCKGEESGPHRWMNWLNPIDVSVGLYRNGEKKGEAVRHRQRRYCLDCNLCEERWLSDIGD